MAPKILKDQCMRLVDNITLIFFYYCHNSKYSRSPYPPLSKWRWPALQLRNIEIAGTMYLPVSEVEVSVVGGIYDSSTFIENGRRKALECLPASK